MPTKSATKKAVAPRPSRFGLRASKAQELVLRRGAEASHKSLTDFILDSACSAAEKMLLDQRVFMVSGQKYQSLLEMLDSPSSKNAGLKGLFSKPAPWNKH